jgi:hypothetical protein
MDDGGVATSGPDAPCAPEQADATPAVTAVITTNRTAQPCPPMGRTVV